MGNKVPAKRAMIAYFENDVANTEGFVGRPRTTLPITISQDLEWMKEAADERTTQNRPNSRKKTKKEIAKEEQLAKLYNELPNQLKTIDDLKSLEKLANARKRWRQLVDDAHALRSQRAKAK
jgi:molecular chaperone GrpE (heat shock protein)